MHIATMGGGLKNRAFTLIELLAVIVILAVIALIASPIIMGVIGKTKKQAFERSIDGILEAVRIDYSSDGFVSPREYFYEGNNLILLTVSDETLDESVGIKGKINGKGFIYVDEDGTIHIENVCSKDYCANGTEPNVVITENVTGEIPELSKNDPMIKIKGDKTVYVNIGDTYAELGATAKTKSGQVLEYTTEITLNGAVVTTIDTTNENTYVITYKTEHEGKTVTDTRNVVILDMKPVISITEGKESYVKEQVILITVSAVRPNTITSFTVEIKKDGENLKTETVNGISKTITLNETGNYEVIVTVTDNHEHTSTMTKAYKIDSEPPEIEFTSEITLKANEVSGFVLTEDDTVKVSDNSNTVTWKTEGNLNSTVGDQEITYIATDEAGNETRVERVFHVEPADGPVLNSNSASSNEKWIKPTTIRLSAEIQTENDELTEFTYQVDDGEIVNVPITNNKLMDVEVALNTTGKHTIKVTATGKHGNTTPLPLGEFWIDAVIPELIMNNSSYNDKYGNSKQLSTLYTAKFGEMGGDVECKNGSTEIANVNEIKLAGTYSIKCTATGKNEKSTEKTITVTLNPRTFTEIMSGTGRFNEEAKTFEEVMRPLLGSSVSNNDPDHNLRYVGSNPNNYVSFNGEKWRIIGIFDGQAKIIRDDFYSTHIEFDENEANGGHGDRGNSDWNESTTQKELNTTFLNRINASSKNMIDQTYSWTLGGPTTYNQTRQELYELERSSESISTSATWTGAIGLLYPSDYGYATSSTNSICNTTNMSAWSSGDASSCSGSEYNWLRETSFHQWTMTPQSNSTSISLYINTNGMLWNRYSYGIGNTDIGVKPALYLKTNIKIKSGKGTEDDPYILTEADVDTKDPDKNPRYVGSNPSNYVSFNNGEKWRIVGILDGKVKIARAEPIGLKPWDNDPSHGEYGWNDWEQATLQLYLNNEYFNKEIEATSRNYIDVTTTWPIGGINTSRITRAVLYEKERGDLVYTGRPTEWPNGKIGLIHISDFAYATNGGSVCDTESIPNWSFADVREECGNKSWLFTSSNQWSLTLSSLYNNFTCSVSSAASIDCGYTSRDLVVRPTLYLKSAVKIKGGTGSNTDPYIIGT